MHKWNVCEFTHLRIQKHFLFSVRDYKNLDLDIRTQQIPTIRTLVFAVMLAAAFLWVPFTYADHKDGHDTNPPDSSKIGRLVLSIHESAFSVDPTDANRVEMDGWHVQASNINDLAYGNGPTVTSELIEDPTGFMLNLPKTMLQEPLVISAWNELLPRRDIDGDGQLEYPSFEIFVPAGCWDMSAWVIGPAEDAVWRYYRRASALSANAWDPSRVDCVAWLDALQTLVATATVDNAVSLLVGSENMLLDDAVLIQAFQLNQNALVPTRSPICVAQDSSRDGAMQRGSAIDPGDFPSTIDNAAAPDGPFGPAPDSDPVVVGVDGMVDSICGLGLDVSLSVNGTPFSPSDHYVLDDPEFMGRVHDQSGIVPNMNVSAFNARAGNGKSLDAGDFASQIYDDACSITGLLQITNTDDNEQDVLVGTGVTLTELFGPGGSVAVYKTSDGDTTVDDNDHWVILHEVGDAQGRETVLAVELPGHRQEDFRDVLHMHLTGQDLFLGLRADFELNEEEVDGEQGFMSFTLSVWDGSTVAGRTAVRRNVFNCYEAADPWARQFLVEKIFHTPPSHKDWWVDAAVKPLDAAEFAVRSQCLSNGMNASWQSPDSGIWSMNSTHGSNTNLTVPPGWLAPALDFEIYIQKFDEAVFKGPRTIRTSDRYGQIMAAVPTLVQGDRVLLKAEDNCCDDYDLVVPCDAEFTGFESVTGEPIP